jgi:hypothetical protein
LCALNGFGVLSRRRGRFALRREARRYLTQAMGTDLVDALRMGAMLDDKFRDLAGVVRTGERRDFHQHLQPAEWRLYLRGLGALAGIAAGEVARAIPLAQPQRLLDVGGGHGRFGMALCRRHPTLRAEILDLPPAVEVCRELVAEAGLAERIALRAGDLRHAEWGGDHDAVLLFNVLHNLPEPDAAAAVHKAHAALGQGGVLAILEGQHAGGDGNLSFQEGFGELFFHVLSGSLTWPAPTLRGWMQQAGFERIQHKKLLSLPGAVLLIGRRGPG